MTRRYALCGLSNRGIASFALPMLGLDRDGAPSEEDHSAVAELVAVVEPDAVRAAAFDSWLTDHGRPPLPRHDSVDALLADPDAPELDALVVASPDHTHIDHLRAGLAHGLDVVTEKPMVTTTEDARAVLAAEAASTGRVLVTHNFRYPPRHLQLKELLRAGRIGRVVQVLLEYHVDTSHGASYFVRWNRATAASGGLTLHKSTHHLDLVGWLLDDEPVRVAAAGGRWFYGPDSPHRPRAADGTALTGTELRAADPYWRTMVDRGAVAEP
ncbi:MAG TPA: Gfo/Idh/MocA family oxidoreductase, partial [Bacillota bacterium]|nr:Gfo/Idh/MocA family oxidoreductase [Bacillota bacterium]